MGGRRGSPVRFQDSNAPRPGPITGVPPSPSQTAHHGQDMPLAVTQEAGFLFFGFLKCLQKIAYQFYSPYIYKCQFIFNTIFIIFRLFTNRYIELVYPFWHKTHFKMKYLHISLATCWVFGIGLNAAYKIPTSKVIIWFFVNLKIPWFNLLLFNIHFTNLVAFV